MGRHRKRGPHVETAQFAHLSSRNPVYQSQVVRSSPLPQDQEISSSRFSYYPTPNYQTLRYLHLLSVLCAFRKISPMDVRPEDLLPDEKVLMNRSATPLVNIKDYGLNKLFFAGDLLRLAGIKNIEGIGGKLCLTNYRLLLKSHAINRLTGKFSIALPTIQSVKDTSQFVMKRIEIGTNTETFEFLVLGIPELIAAIDKARAALTTVEVEHLRAVVATNYNKFADGLKVAHAVEMMNNMLLAARKSGALAKIAAGASNSFEISGIMNFLELIGDETPAEESSTG